MSCFPAHNRNEKKTSPRVFREAVRITFSRTQREEARLRFPASVATNEDFERFTERLLAALQIAVGGFLPALFVTYSWLCPFIECERFEIEEVFPHVKGDDKSTPPDIWQYARNESPAAEALRFISRMNSMYRFGSLPNRLEISLRVA